MAGAYLITLDSASGHTLKDGANACIVYAENSADALAVAKSKYDGDSDAMWAAATATALVAGTDMADYRLAVRVLDSDPEVDVLVEADDTWQLKTAAVGDAAGSGYTTNDLVEVDGAGVSAVLKVTASGGAVTGLTIVSHGAFTSDPGTNEVTTTKLTGSGDDALTVDITTVKNTIEALAAKAVDALNAHSLIAAAAFNFSTNVLTIAAAGDGLGDKTVEVEVLPPATAFPGAVAVPGFASSIVDNGSAGAALTVTLGADARSVPVHYGSFKTV